MKPAEMISDPMGDLFRHRLENILDMRHELIRLSKSYSLAYFSEGIWRSL